MEWRVIFACPKMIPSRCQPEIPMPIQFADKKMRPRMTRMARIKNQNIRVRADSKVATAFHEHARRPDFREAKLQRIRVVRGTPESADGAE